MKLFKNYKYAGSFLALLLISALHPVASKSADVCSQGKGIPPFLSPNAEPNLLLALDNSGSMLDLAYVDELGKCTDNKFRLPDPDKKYAGLFETGWEIIPLIEEQEKKNGQDDDTAAALAYRYNSKKWYSWNGGTFEEVYYTSSTDIPVFDSLDNPVLDEEGNPLTVPSAVFDPYDVNYTPTGSYTHGINVTTPFSSAPGIVYKQEDLIVVIDTDLEGTPTVTAFAASGELLNWASASKFDIQKKILTGGKYDPTTKEYMSEGRACSARPFVKEVPVTNIDGVEVPVADIEAGEGPVITFSIRGLEQYGDPSDPAHVVTRIGIMGVTEGGFIGSLRNQACQDALTEYARPFSDTEDLDARLGVLKGLISTCLAYDGTNNVLSESNAAYNQGVMECWYRVKHPDKVNSPTDFGQVNDVENACYGVYTNGVYPSTISPANSGYLCYGDNTSNTGYVGRCWDIGEPPEGCTFTDCVYDAGNPGTQFNTCFADGTVYECLYTYKLNKGVASCSNGSNKDAWTPVLPDGCTLSDIDLGTSAAWDPSGNSEKQTCIQEALWDYCGDLELPEVIDSTSQLATAGKNWGIVGALTDSGITAEFGTEQPIIMMEGYIKKTDGTTPPTGVIHEVADNLRIGVMAFNANGSEYECSQVAGDLDPIDAYCPDDTPNRDGANVLVPIAKGDSIPDPTDQETKHVDVLTSEINRVPADSWTPLAEAMYNALGYYGQNSNYHLYGEDFSNTEDPVLYGCQSNNILIITEGASTADIHPDVAQKVADMATMGIPGYIATNEGECKSTGLDPEDSEDPGDSELYGSTYLDNMTLLGQHTAEAEVYASPEAGDGKTKQDITTWMVVTGKKNDDITATGECNPAVLMQQAADYGQAPSGLLEGEEPSAVERNIREALNSILNRASSGSASSVISSSRSGEGAAYQAIFWPKIPRDSYAPLTWVGDVHAFFIDDNGWFWDDYNSGEDSSTAGNLGKRWSEDTDGNGIRNAGDLGLDNSPLEGDRRVTTFYNATEEKTQICYNPRIITLEIVNSTDPEPTAEEIDAFTNHGGCMANDYAGSKRIGEIDDFKSYLWSAADQLSQITDTSTNRSTKNINNKRVWDFQADGSKLRHIFTWNDLNNDGIVDQSSEILDFVSNMNSATVTAQTSTDRDDLLTDFRLDDNIPLNDLIEWIRGDDLDFEVDTDYNGFEPNNQDEDKNLNGIQDSVYRCRKDICDPEDDNYNSTENISWRLGDIIHSTPTLVSRPAERYHFPYKDPGYFQFYNQYRHRRHVIYFGGNDGMLHAVNAGFFEAAGNRFMKCSKENRDTDGNCSTGPYASLGQELWAYIPYNLQPHLACLMDGSYDLDHKYFVDGPPRIFDVRIFPDDSIHPDGWGTILVGQMRLGGAPVAADIDDGDGLDDLREFVSSYFVLDITDPEGPPTLIAEMTMTNETEDYDGDGSAENKFARLGYTTPMPTVVPMRNDDGNSEWFLILGNGPTTIKGENNQQGKIAIVPLNSLTGVNTVNTTETELIPFRIPNTEPLSSSTPPNIGIKTIPDDNANPPINSFIGDMVSVDYDLSVKSTDYGIPYKNDVVYFGTVDGDGFMPDGNGGSRWDGKGRFFRLLTRILEEEIVQIDPLKTNIVQKYAYPEDWTFEKVLDAQAPITAAPNVAYDGTNYWVYFGTGRYFANEDKTDDATQYFYGIKEPRTYNPSTKTCDFTWADIDWFDNNTGQSIPTDPTFDPGDQGLFRTDQIRVIQSGTLTGTTNDYVFCETEGDCSLDLVGTGAVNPNGADGRTYYLFNDLRRYIQGERCSSTIYNTSSKGTDGWYREFNESRERSLGMPTLLGGLTTFTGHQPPLGACESDGESYLYGVYYLTGTSWTENVFDPPISSYGSFNVTSDRIYLGKGLTTTPSLQVGSGDGPDATAYIQTSTGEIIEVGQENLPIQNFKSGRTSWRTR